LKLALYWSQQHNVKIVVNTKTSGRTPHSFYPVSFIASARDALASCGTSGVCFDAESAQRTSFLPILRCGRRYRKKDKCQNFEEGSMLMRRNLSLRWIGFAAMLLLAAGSRGWCQNASISGIVTDTSGAVVPDAQATLLNKATEAKLATTSNKDGVYTLAGVTPGTWNLTITANGFKTEQRTDIPVNVGSKISLDVELSVGSAGEQVTVSGSGQNINTTDASVSTVVDRQFVENLPLNGRSFQSLITVAPGTEVVPSQGQGSSGEISVNGQRTEANYYTVDGVSANTGATVSSSGFVGGGFSGATPQDSALGTTQSIISIDALEEFRESTSTYSAEYGRNPGGQFSFISRSGTNDFHGTAYDFLRNDAMDAKNYFDTTKLPERQNDFGGSLGGPIWIPHLYNGHDKTFFFFSYEALRLQNPQAAALTEVPSNDFRTAVKTSPQATVQAVAPFLAAFPVSSGPDLGGNSAGLAYYTAGYSAPSDLDNRNIRVDHSFGDRFKLFGRYTDVPSNSLLRQPTDLAQVNNTVRNVKMAMLGLDTVLSNTMVDELRFGLTGNDYKSQRYLDNFGGATPLKISSAPGLTDGDWMTFFLFYGNYPYYLIEPQSNRQRQINVVDALTQTVGRHTLKYGVDYRRLVTSEELPPLWEVAFYYSEADVLSNTPAGLYVYTQSINMKALTPNFSVYGQDEWKISDRLNASLGLRWDVNPAPTDLNGNQPYTVTQITNLATTMAAPKGTPLWKTVHNAFAPRVGLAYQVRRTPGLETVVRAGGGIFYDTGSTQSAQSYYGIGTTGFESFATGFPATQQQVQGTPKPSANAPYNASIYAYDPHLKLPYTEEWNLAVEQGLGTAQTLTLGYVGSAGRRLLVQRLYYPETYGNEAFSGGNGLYITNNAASSNYHALQAQFTRKMSEGLQFLASYTWSHNIDTASSNFLVYTLERGPSDYDIRNNFQAALSYEVGGKYSNPYAAYLLKYWSVDSRISARSSLPVDITQQVASVTTNGTAVIYHPNRTAAPLYLHGGQYPGGRAINFNAFAATDNTEGNAGRNSARAFDAAQVDITLRRDFPFTERVGMEFRAEGYNVLNHPIFGNIYNSLSSGAALFGVASNTENSQLGGLGALYQVGGPRSLQVSLKLHF
jgi:hypothetical protein